MQGREKTTQQAKHWVAASHSVSGWHLRYLKYSTRCYREKQQDRLPSAVKVLMIYGFWYFVVFLLTWWINGLNGGFVCACLTIEWKRSWRTINHPLRKTIWACHQRKYCQMFVSPVSFHLQTFGFRTSTSLTSLIVAVQIMSPGSSAVVEVWKVTSDAVCESDA